MFERTDVKRWRRTIHKELRPLREPSDSPTYRAAMVLAAIYGFGTDITVLAEVSGQALEFVRGVLKRARKTRMLKGQTLHVGWNEQHGLFALMVDAMVAEGTCSRPPDPKRSAAQKARQHGRGRGTSKRRQVVSTAGAVFTPKITRSNPLYGLTEWVTEGRR